MKKIFLIAMLLSVPHLSISMNRRSLVQPQSLVGITKPIVKKTIIPPLATKSIIQSLNNCLWLMTAAKQDVETIASNPMIPTKQTLTNDTQKSLEIALREIQCAANTIKALKPYNQDTKNDLLTLTKELTANMAKDIEDIKILTQYSILITKAFINKLEEYQKAIGAISKTVTSKTILTKSSKQRIQQTTENLYGNGIATVYIENTPIRRNL